MNIKRSINVKYDIISDQLIKDYSPTASHSEIISNVFKGVLNEGIRSHIAFGPYGAGKSFISTIIAGFLSKHNYDKNTVENFLHDLKNVDENSSVLFKQALDIDTTYLPVIINGYEGSFSRALIKNLKKSLSVFDDMNISNRNTQVNRIVHKWESSFSDTYQSFHKMTEELGYTVSSFLENIENDDIYNQFNEFYSSITSGAELPDETEDVVAVFEEACRKLKGKKYGLILIYDEFGRLLQNIDQEHVNQFMQQLQNLAELANNGLDNLSLLFIAHKPISHYFTYFDRNTKDEFSKIEKRFTITSINSDFSTFINLSRKFIRDAKVESASSDYIQSNVKELRKYKFFSSYLNETEIENVVISGCYPLHPITVFLLPQISKLYGQNERTLFTFLTDRSTHGFMWFIDQLSGRNPKRIYTPDYLVDYFIGKVDISKETEIYHSMMTEIIYKIQDRDLELTLRLFKLVLIWSITNTNEVAALNEQLISFSLHESEEEVSRVLNRLVELKFIRFNRSKKFWQLLNRDIVDLDIELVSRSSIYNTDKNKQIVAINKYNPYKIIYCENYNNELEMTRFAIMKINIFQYPDSPLINDNFDFLINFNFNKHTSVEPISHKIELDLNVDFEIEEIRNKSIKLAVLDDLLQDKKFMFENGNPIHEIEYEKNITQRELASILRKAIENSYLKTNLSETKVRSYYHLVNLLDKFATSTFYKSVLIKNDQVNMFEVSKQQEAAIIKVISLMITSESNEIEDKFVGNKPDYLIYHSILHANLLDLTHRINQFLSENDFFKYSELVKIVTSRPYGVRPTLASLIIINVLIVKWKHLMFYGEGNFISDLKAEQIYQAGLGKLDFEVVYSDFDFRNSQFLESLYSVFSEHSESVKNKSLSIRVLSSMNNWLVNLPVITQLGDSLKKDENRFLKIIKLAKINPTSSIQDLIENFSETEIIDVKKAIEDSFCGYISKIDNRIRESLGIESWYKWANSVDQIKRKSDDFIKICLISNANVLIEYAKILDRTDISRWPLPMFTMLENKVLNIVRDSNETIARSYINVNGVQKEVVEMVLSNKAQNLQRNIASLLDANSRYVSKEEIEKVILNLVESYID